MKAVFGAMTRSRIALETGMHSPWVSRLLTLDSFEDEFRGYKNARLFCLLGPGGKGSEWVPFATHQLSVAIPPALDMEHQDNSGSVHWSKELVEHLRTVHFALITVSVGLVLLILSSRPYSPAAAITQLEVLEDAGNSWDVNRILAPHISPDLTGGRGFPRVVVVHFEKDLVLNLLIVRFWLMLSPDEHFVADTPVVDSYVARPSTNVLGLRSWWSIHSVDQKFAVMGRVSSEGKAKKRITGTEGGLEPKEYPAYLYPFQQPPSAPPMDTINVQLKAEGGKRWDLSGMYNAPFGANPVVLFPFLAYFDTDVSTVTVHPTDFINVQKGCGSFESCFPDLAAASKGFELLKLADFKNHVTQELEKGDTVFEAFGLKVPLQFLTSGGIVVVLSVQLYFYLHMREFHAKIKKSDSGWDVPWIGVYGSTLARAAYLATMVMPVAAVALLSSRASVSLRRAFLQQQARLDKALITGEIGLLVLAVFAAALLMWLAWKHRPRPA